MASGESVVEIHPTEIFDNEGRFYYEVYYFINNRSSSDTLEIPAGFYYYVFDAIPVSRPVYIGVVPAGVEAPTDILSADVVGVKSSIEDIHLTYFAVDKYEFKFTL